MAKTKRRTFCPKCGAKYNADTWENGYEFTCIKCSLAITVGPENTRDMTGSGPSKDSARVIPQAAVEKKPAKKDDADFFDEKALRKKAREKASRRLKAITEELPKDFGTCTACELLGTGATGTVYKGRHRVLDTEVAIKVISQQVVDANPNFAERFLREARVAAKINHKNVVTMLDAGETRRGERFLVMEYVHGETLEERLAREGKLRESEAIRIGIAIAEGLGAAGEFNIVHRDIKPANVMLADRGMVKIMDLGLAKEIGEDQLDITADDTMLGTPNYLAPEQIRSARGVDLRSDMYSLGVMLYECVTGELPFKGKNAFDVINAHLTQRHVPARDLDNSISAPFSAVIDRMLEKEPPNRFLTYEKLIEALRDIQTPEAPVAEVPEEKGLVRETPPVVESVKRQSATYPRRSSYGAVPRGSRGRRIDPLVILLAVGIVVLGGFIGYVFLFPADTGETAKPDEPIIATPQTGAAGDKPRAMPAAYTPVVVRKKLEGKDLRLVEALRKVFKTEHVVWFGNGIVNLRYDFRANEELEAFGLDKQAQCSAGIVTPVEGEASGIFGFRLRDIRLSLPSARIGESLTFKLNFLSDDEFYYFDLSAVSRRAEFGYHMRNDTRSQELWRQTIAGNFTGGFSFRGDDFKIVANGNSASLMNFIFSQRQTRTQPIFELRVSCKGKTDIGTLDMTIRLDSENYQAIRLIGHQLGRMGVEEGLAQRMFDSDPDLMIQGEVTMTLDGFSFSNSKNIPMR